MVHEKQDPSAPRGPQDKRPRKPYAKPGLTRYGDVRDLTQGTGTTKNEGQPGGMMN